MNLALNAWLRAAPEGGAEAAAVAAAEAVARGPDGQADPWRVIEQAGELARCALREAPRDLGLTEALRVVEPASERCIARVPAGAPYPDRDLAGRQRRGAFDTPKGEARALVRAALAATPLRGCARDPACGTGAFLVALAEAGIRELQGNDLDPVAVAVARVAAPGARIEVADGFAEQAPAALVLTNPPYVSAERQDKGLRQRLGQRFPWLSGRFDLSVPFAAQCVASTEDGGATGLLIPDSLLCQPYGRPLRLDWLDKHQLCHLGQARPFPGASVRVTPIVLRIGAGPAPIAETGVPAGRIRALAHAPLHAWLAPGDIELLEQVQARSQPLGALCEIDTGVVSHGYLGGKARLLHSAPGPGRVPYADARDLVLGRRRWLDYRPDEMHRPKRPELFEGPKIVVARIRTEGRVRAWLDREGTYVGHTLTVLRPLQPSLDLEELLAFLGHPLTAGLLRLEMGERIDLYPHDLARLPVPEGGLNALLRDLSGAQQARLTAIGAPR